MRKLNWLLLLGLLAGCESLTIDSGPEDDDVAAHTQFTAPTYDGDAEAADQEHSRRAREIYLGGVAALQASPPDVDRAMRDFQLALAADPLFYKAHFKLGICYYLQGKYHLEINEYKLCLATNRNYVPAWLNLGHAYLVMDQLEEARDAYQHVLDLQPSHAVALYNKALVDFDLGNESEALRLFRAFLEVDDGDGEMGQRARGYVQELEHRIATGEG